MSRYNKVNRWVIADMIRRGAYHYPHKKALIFKEKALTYSELHDARSALASLRRRHFG